MFNTSASTVEVEFILITVSQVQVQLARQGVGVDLW